MSRLPVRVPISPADVHAFINAAQAGRLCFELGQVAPVVGLKPAFLTAACQQLVVEHTNYHDTLGMTLEQVRKLLDRLISGGDLPDEVLTEAFLREQSQPDRLNEQHWAGN